MAESPGKFNGTVTSIDVRTGFCLIRSNDSSSDELFIHKSFITALDFIPPTVGETVEVLVVERNNDDPEKLDPTCTAKSYIQRWRHLVKSDEDETGKVEERNWAMLPFDILSIIFKKVGAAVVIASAQFVCKPWRQLSKEPHLWKCVDIKLKDALSISTEMTNADLNKVLLEFIAMVAVDRSDGCLEEFSVEGFGTNVLMNYMAERATQLRCLRLISVYGMSDETVVEAVKRFPELEEFGFSPGSFSFKAVGSVGNACPCLKTLILRLGELEDFQSIKRFITWGDFIDLSTTAAHMHQLRCLEISSGTIFYRSLCDLLDSCPRLEYLDVSHCLLDFDENLKMRCASIKEARLPSTSMNDFLSSIIDMFS